MDPHNLEGSSDDTSASPAPSLREELSKQFDTATPSPTPAPAPNGGDASAATAPSPSASTPAPAPAGSPPAGQKPGESPAQDAQDMAALQAAAQANRPIPERLKAKWGATWDKLDSNVRDQFHAYESDIGRLSSKYGKDAAAWNRTQQIFAPYEAMTRAQGGDFHSAVGNLFETARILHQGAPEQKVALVQQMIKAYGIPFPSGGQGEVASPQHEQPGNGLSPEFVNRFAHLERTVLTRDAEESHNLRQRVTSDIETFLADPANVYLQEPGYLDTMQSLIAAGRATDLKGAYEQAAWLHDRTREVEIAKRNQPRIADAAAAASAARAAAVSQSGSSPGIVKRDPSKMSLRETLEEAYSGNLD